MTKAATDLDLGASVHYGELCQQCTSLTRPISDSIANKFSNKIGARQPSFRLQPPDLAKLSCSTPPHGSVVITLDSLRIRNPHEYASCQELVRD